MLNFLIKIRIHLIFTLLTMDKKPVVIIFLSILTIGMGIFNIFLIPFIPPPIKPDLGTTLFVGTTSGPDTLDPVNSWDDYSNVILEQVVEPLFFYDLYDLDLPRINVLAESYFWENLTSLHIKLREGVRFHDGTSFNADAAKWNFDRLLYLTNCTGTNTNQVAQTQTLWMLPDGETSIINNVITVGKYNITLILNAPYAPLLNTLAYINAGMISPTAHKDEKSSFIHALTGTPIGTGPYKYVQYKTKNEVVLSRWEGYWRNLAIFKTVKFLIYEEIDDLSNAIWSHQIDYAYSRNSMNLPSYEDDSSIIVKNFTDDTGQPELACRFYQFNTDELNETWREALSYAINYNNLITEAGDNKRTRASSIISPAFGAAYNSYIIAPIYNITKARQIMLSMDFGNISWTDDQWIAVAESQSPFRVINCSESDYERLSNTFRLIGIKTDPIFKPWLSSSGSKCIQTSGSDIEASQLISYSQCDILLVGWAPDYFDAFNMLYNALKTKFGFYLEWGFLNWEIVEVPILNDTWINSKLDLALETLDDETRNNIYKDIQWYLSETLHSHAFVYHNKIRFVHSADLYEIPYNALVKFQAYGIRRG
ncbi:MAG: ABC transporter substrate-binding protein [Promethearchaeota archaeon]|nr:MAG: ABC transporter substrate-binding protein [Candidatus Lokiarchaeota archaeon]